MYSKRVDGGLILLEQPHIMSSSFLYNNNAEVKANWREEVRGTTRLNIYARRPI